MISIIVPVYNAERFVENTIETVKNQTFTDWELLLVDDCSKDNSVKKINDYLHKYGDEQGRIRLIRQEENKGAAMARNRGIDEARGRYIAFLDADDVWMPDKLEKEIQFMNKHSAGFVFSAYEFGDGNAVPNGKMVRVPKTLNFKSALTRTVIFTSTVLIDTEIIDKKLIYMPPIGSEDTATWWKILKAGHIAYGLDQPLAIYRRPEVSLSSNKVTAIERIWNLYINVAGLSKLHAFLCIMIWAIRASLRRFLAETVRAHIETVKRFTVVQLSVLGIIMYTGIYAYVWFNELYPILNLPRISQDGFYFGGGLKLYFRGHILILIVYFSILLFMSQSSGGLRTGYLKPSNIFVSEIVALVLTNAITYFQLSLMRNWLMPLKPMFGVFFLQVFIVGIWAFVADAVYRHVFPPRETLVIDLQDIREYGNEELHYEKTGLLVSKNVQDGNDGTKVYSIKRKSYVSLSFDDTEAVINRFNSRSDRFKVMKVMQYCGNFEEIMDECLRWYGCVVINGGEERLRKQLLEFCYMHLIRVYLIPDMGDILLQGTQDMELFDTPILELKEYSARWEERVVKRTVDIVIGTICTLFCLPYYIYRLMRGDKVVKIPCMTRDGKIYKRYGFSSDKEIDALAFINVLNGSMSLVGPTSVVASAENSDDVRVAFRYRMKPGITGYYQIYGNRNANAVDILKMDIFYIQHFGLLNDFKLMLQALSFIIGLKKRRGK
ncbi:glycosyltransferase [Butyrivibrio sp. YAB3001]|uniref:glycosyltransferase n=1 Tax=Butyrivibrio sp. YAB3001 TaxID=1520812 RepID=UPI0008F6272B|nr:glycosyltransferase [Butyrivibrio sp. YAB3001]SFC10797.1 Glycosyltransferase involved in cell wall bisynthesis [Butyrivibrio sp. YAB3001]